MVKFLHLPRYRINTMTYFRFLGEVDSERKNTTYAGDRGPGSEKTINDTKVRKKAKIRTDTIKYHT